MKRISIVLALWRYRLCFCWSRLWHSDEESTTTGAPTTGAPTTAAPSTDDRSATTEATAASTGKKEVIGVCLPAMDNPLMLEIKDTFVKQLRTRL